MSAHPYIPDGNTPQDLEEAKKAAEAEMRAAMEVIWALTGTKHLGGLIREPLTLAANIAQLISIRMFDLRRERAEGWRE